MTTLAELADSFNTVVTAVELAAQYDDGGVGSKADVTRGRMARLLVNAWLNAMEEFRVDQDGREPAPVPQAPLPPTLPAAAAVQAPAPGPLADTLAKIAAGLQQAPVAPPAPAPASPGVQGSFDEWVALADALGRNVADLQRQWHSPRDGIEGGWDRATDAQRAEQMAKALAYYNNKAAEPGEIDYTVCFKCGSKGRELKTRTGETFFACSNERCGFNGREGKFVNTTWDAESYSEKRSKWEDTKRRGQQRGYARR